MRGASPAAAKVSLSIRYEHVLIHRWLDELGRSARAAAPDPLGFARRADRLLGLIEAHLELEDAVFLPVLDRAIAPGEGAAALDPRR